MGRIIAERLKKAREEAGLTQEAFARSLALSPEFISLLESGKRKPSLDTLSRIAAFFHRDMSYFLNEKEHVFTLLFRAAALDDGIYPELEHFRGYVENYLRLEEETGRRLEPAPSYGNISPERLAAEERRRLGLGDEPIRDVFALFERNGCRIMRRPMSPEARISGAFVYIEDQNAAFALINASQTMCRQTFTAAHEYCHYLKDRHDASILDTEDIFNAERQTDLAAKERYAQEFAARFLLPPAKVLEIVDREFGGRSGTGPGRSRGTRAGKAARDLSYDEVLLVKRYFGVSAQAMLRTLRDLGLIAAARYGEFLARDPIARERELFGDTDEEWCGSPGIEAKEAAGLALGPEVVSLKNGSGPDDVIVSDRYKLLQNLTRSFHPKRGFTEAHDK